MNSEWILLVAAAAILIIGTYLIGRVRQPLQAYIRILFALGLIALFWLAPSDADIFIKALITLVGALSIYRAVLAIKAHGRDSGTPE